MQKYYEMKENKMSENYDVIIAGTGAGGLYSALNLPQHLKVLIITKQIGRAHV